MATALTPAQVIAGEAVSGSLQDRWNDMLNIASVMQNRAMLTGAPLSDVVSVQSQFNAYQKSLPAGTQNYVDLAQQALDYVATNGPVNNATYYATPAAVSNLPNGLQPETSTAGHQYFSDPEMRGIKTAIGTITPDASKLTGVLAEGAPIPSERPANVPDLSKTGILGALFSSQPTQAANSFSDLAAAGPVSSPFASVKTPTVSGWNSVAAAGPMGGYPADPMERMGTPVGPVAAGNTDVGSGTGTPTDVASRMGLPASSDFTTMASASPIQSPMAMPSLNNFADLAAATPVSSPAATSGLLSGPPMAGTLGTVSQQGLLSGMSNALNAADQQATSTPMLSQAMNPSFPTLSQPIDVGQLSANSPFASPTVDPSVEASLNSIGNSLPSMASPTQDRFAAAPAGFDANRFGTPDITSAMNQSIANSVAASPTTPTAPSIADATPTSTGLLSGYQATPSSTPAENAISGILSGPATTEGNMSMLGQAMNPSVPAMSMSVADRTFAGPNLQSALNPTTAAISNFNNLPTTSDIGVSDPTYGNFASLSFPSAPTQTVDNTPSIQGPASIPATTQQTDISPVGIGTTTAPQAQKSGFFNKGTIIGGLLGGAVAGPVGGILGGLVGNKVNQGGLTGLLGGSHPMSINPVTGSLANIAGIYGGSMPVGTQTTASNGSLITGMPGGWTSVVNPYGVTESVSPWGGYAADWSGMFSGNNGGPSNNGQPGGGGAIGGSGLF